MDSKKFTYKGESFMKPDNISSNLAKRVIDECGGNYGITVQAVINLLSKELKHLPPTLDRAEIEQDFKEINYSLDDLCRNPDRKDAGHAFNNPEPQYLEKRSSIYTKKGIVNCYQINWGTNDKPIIWTVFEMIRNGWKFTAEYRNAPTSDQAMKNMATRFSNLVYKQKTYQSSS